MASLTQQLHCLLLEIKNAKPEDRLAMQAELDALIHEMEAQALPVEPGAKQLNAQLRDDIVESQFENMPV
jgi:hypothetical protein